MIKQEIRDLIAEVNPDAKVFDDHAYDNSIIGMSHDGRVIYCYDLMVQELISEEGWTVEEAIEWIDYNTERALPYFGENAPIILESNPVYYEGALSRTSFEG